jgi:hypothetical protein
MPTTTECPAALNIAGQHYDCDRTTPGHRVHGNTQAAAIWADDVVTAFD